MGARMDAVYINMKTIQSILPIARKSVRHFAGVCADQPFARQFVPSAVYLHRPFLDP